MAITVLHDVVQNALGLAQQAGQGIFRQRQQAADLAFLDLIRQQQAEADRAYANELQTAMEADFARSRLSQAAQQAAAEQSLRERQLGAQVEESQRNAAIRQQSEATDAAAVSARIAETQAKTQQEAVQRQMIQDYITKNFAGPQQAQALAYFQATGKVPETVVPQNPPAPSKFDENADPQVRLLKFEREALLDRLKSAQAQVPLPDAAQVKALQEAIVAKNRELGDRIRALAQASSISNLQIPQVAAQQLVQQGTPAGVTAQTAPSQPRFVRYAANDQGQIIGQLETGQWVRIR